VTYSLWVFLRWACYHRYFHRNLLMKALSCDLNSKLFYCDFFILFYLLEDREGWSHLSVCSQESLSLHHSFYLSTSAIQYLDSFAFMLMGSICSLQQTDKQYFLKLHMMMFYYYSDYLFEMSSKIASILKLCYFLNFLWIVLTCSTAVSSNWQHAISLNYI